MRIEGFREQLASTADLAHTLGDEVSQIAGREDLMMTRPERIASAALSLIGSYHLAAVRTGEIDPLLDQELVRKSILVRRSSAYNSGQAKVRELVRIIKNG